MSTAVSPPAFDGGMGNPTIIVMGVTGCGKSSLGQSLAERLGRRFVEGDDLHPPANIRKMRMGAALDDTDRWPWLDAIGLEINRNAGAIVSCSALTQRYRDRLREPATRPLQFVFLDGDRAVLLERLMERKGHFMPLSLLDSQLQTLERPIGEADVMTISIDQPTEAIVEQVLGALAKPGGSHNPIFT